MQLIENIESAIGAAVIHKKELNVGARGGKIAERGHVQTAGFVEAWYHYYGRGQRGTSVRLEVELLILE